MAKIPETFKFGGSPKLSPEKLLEIMELMYRDLAIAINKKPDIYQRTTDGQASDSFLSNGDININTNTRKVEIITSRPTAATVGWTTLS